MITVLYELQHRITLSVLSKLVPTWINAYYGNEPLQIWFLLKVLFIFPFTQPAQTVFIPARSSGREAWIRNRESFSSTPEPKTLLVTSWNRRLVWKNKTKNNRCQHGTQRCDVFDNLTFNILFFPRSEWLRASPCTKAHAPFCLTSLSTSFQFPLLYTSDHINTLLSSFACIWRVAQLANAPQHPPLLF